MGKVDLIDQLARDTLLFYCICQEMSCLSARDPLDWVLISIIHALLKRLYENLQILK